RLPTGAALFARTENLHDRLRRREVARGGDVFHQRLDVRAEELRGAAANVADEKETTRVPVGRFEAEATIAKVDLAREAGVDHPLERAVDGRAADSGRVAVHERNEIVGADVSLLPKEHVQNAITFGGAFTARRAKARKIERQLINGERLTAAAGGRRVRVLDGETATGDRVDEIDFRAVEVPDADRINE